MFLRHLQELYIGLGSFVVNFLRLSKREFQFLFALLAAGDEGRSSADRYIRFIYIYVVICQEPEPNTHDETRPLSYVSYVLLSSGINIRCTV